ncbi:hypothetical protein DXG03_005515 [Asterophora parasitica]|uniref:Uncharacterized protein n=1 Tax=Asterophora parasitica TaxID=117018 RepID=A0A9P7G7T7_9AGAR|nr:hypothetical protein DXG03_005515 [Asterophora parasitica]
MARLLVFYHSRRHWLPLPSCTLIDVSSSEPRHIKSWVLSRVVRDYEVPEGNTGGLTITFFRTSRNKKTGVPDRDWLYYTGILVILFQLGVATMLVGNWNIIMVTVGGILLVQAQAALPQWRKELWAARPVAHDKHGVICLTRGNGSPYVHHQRWIGRNVHSASTIPATALLFVLWLGHLVAFTMQGMKSGTWYFLAIMAVGMIGLFQNAVASGVRRRPGALGFHLDKVDEIHDEKVYVALQKAEDKEKKVGLALVDVFFTGGLNPSEGAWRNDTLAMYDAYHAAAEKELRNESNFVGAGVRWDLKVLVTAVGWVAQNDALTPSLRTSAPNPTHAHLNARRPSFRSSQS